MRNTDPFPIKWKPESEIDPIEEAKAYVLHEWFQTLQPVKTSCYRCKAVSPVVHIPFGRFSIAFGNPRLMRDSNGARLRDITKEVVQAFAAVGWKYQLRRAYCPVCKGLGSV
jgi:hypothetical protein